MSEPDPSRKPSSAADPRPPVSCYVRTLNEERLIGEVVAAALQVAREVVVVDSGSTDATVAKAKSAGAEVRHQTWLGNGGQKRAGEELCAHDWLLDLDADEIVTAQLAAEIAGLFGRGEPAHSAYALPLVTAPPFGRPWYGTDVARRIKLYDRKVHRMPDHPAWDQLQLPLGTAVGRLKGAVLHHSFTGVAHLISKVNKNTTTRAREAKLKPRLWLSVRILFGLPFYFARRYVLNGLFLRGVYGFAFALTVAVGRWLKDVKMYELHRKRSHGGDD